MDIFELASRGMSREFIFGTSRSSGPGGQHVNKTESKVELRFNVVDSQLLTLEEKNLIYAQLSHRINSQGEIVLTSQASRSQITNKEKVTERFYRLISRALTPDKKRVPTKPTLGSKEKRLKKKRNESIKKERRKKPDEDFSSNND